MLRAYQYTEERTLGRQNESAIWTTAAPKYEQRLGVPFFAEQIADTAHQRSPVLTRLEAFVKDSKTTVQSLDCSEALSGKSFENFSQFTDSAISWRNDLLTENSRGLWSSLINMGDKQRERSNWDAERA